MVCDPLGSSTEIQFQHTNSWAAALRSQGLLLLLEHTAAGLSTWVLTVT